MKESYNHSRPETVYRVLQEIRTLALELFQLNINWAIVKGGSVRAQRCSDLQVSHWLGNSTDRHLQCRDGSAAESVQAVPAAAATQRSRADCAEAREGGCAGAREGGCAGACKCGSEVRHRLGGSSELQCRDESAAEFVQAVPAAAATQRSRADCAEAREGGCAGACKGGCAGAREGGCAGAREGGCAGTCGCIGTCKEAGSWEAAGR